MSTIDRKYKLIRKCEMFNGAIEDTERGRGWRLMERRLPSVRQQSDLLITHCFGGVISLFMQIGSRDSKSEEGSVQYYRWFVFPHCVRHAVQLIRKGLIDLLPNRHSTGLTSYIIHASIRKEGTGRTRDCIKTSSC